MYQYGRTFMRSMRARARGARAAALKRSLKRQSVRKKSSFFLEPTP
jgi:hypothetical protein